MHLNLGNKIRELRRRDGRTQEALADAIGVTSQAVSRWEANGGYPDMEMIPSIANYFGISIDELFGYDNVREKRIDGIVTQLREMLSQNNGVDVNIDECTAIARNAIIEFPANERLLLCLADILYVAGYVKYHEHHLNDAEGYDVYDVERHRNYKEWAEAITIYEKVLPTLADGPARHKAIGWLTQLYLNIGEHKKAGELAETAPGITCCREFLQLKACDGKERAARYSETVLKVLAAAADLIADAVASNKGIISNEDAETYIKNAAEIFGLVCPDGEYGQYRVWSAHLYLYLSTYQWRNGKQDAAFESLDRSLMHMKRCGEFSQDSAITFDSPLLKNVRMNPDGIDFASKVSELPSYWPWICIPDYSDVASEMQADPRWDEWVTRAAANG